ncbi:MAG: PduL/EutD family phosphate acyltransferase [Bacilli bacterium]
MNVKIGVSNHHMHISKEDYMILFGDEVMEEFKQMNQPNEFSTTKKVRVVGPKGELDVRLMGPFREYTQVELSKTDAYILGINPPITKSGSLQDASSLIIVGTRSSITRNCAIIHERHIHINEVKVNIEGIKGGQMSHVYLKETPNGFYEMHIDTDDANAFLLKNGDVVDIEF